MRRGRARSPKIEAVALVFRHLDLEYLSARSVAATYGLPLEPVEWAFQAAEDEGFIEQDADAGLYCLTPLGRQAISYRGPGAPMPELESSLKSTIGQ